MPAPRPSSDPVRALEHVRHPSRCGGTGCRRCRPPSEPPTIRTRRRADSEGPAMLSLVVNPSLIGGQPGLLLGDLDSRHVILLAVARAHHRLHQLARRGGERHRHVVLARAAASIRSMSFRISRVVIVGVKSRGLSNATFAFSQGEASVLCAIVSSMRFQSSPALRPSAKRLGHRLGEVDHERVDHQLHDSAPPRPAPR